MSLIEAYSGDEDDRRRLLRIDKLLQVRDTRVEFARKHHRNTNGSPMDFRDPYLHDIYNSLSPRIALQASVQGQPLYAKVHTPNGWVEMGELKEGSEISGCLGGTQLVQKIHPLGKVSVYEIKLSDGRKTRATWDHQWLVFCDEVISIINTYELASLVVRGKVPYLPASSIPGSGYTESPSVASVIYLEEINSQCITVSNSDSLYVTDDYIVTKNCGKFLSVDCPIHTPHGWKKMGDVRLGDIVSTPDGKNGKVTGVFPQGVQSLYKITLSDGRVVEAGLPHLWKVFCRNKKGKGKRCYYPHEEVLTTEQIMGRMGEDIFSLPSPEPLQKPEVSLPIPPYLLGFLIGDGYFGPRKQSFSTSDEELLQYIEEDARSIGLEFTNDTGYNYYFRNLGKDYSSNTRKKFAETLNKLGLLGKNSHEKFVPKIYMDGSIDQRIAVLQGLMDSDGTAANTGGVTISFTSEQLIRDVQELIWSLGGTSKISARQTTCVNKGTRKLGKPSWRLSISIRNPKKLFRLKRKSDRVAEVHRRTRTIGPVITKIEYSRDAESQCIAIDHPDKLYIMDQYVVTHNSEFLIIDHFAMAKCGLSVLFVLPKYDLRNRFVQNRINKCVERVSEYSKIMGSGFFDSVQLKYFGGGTINYVGSNVEKDFYEIPTNCAIVDEYDNCHQENLRFVADRMSAATNLYPFIRWAGNPRFSNLGINQKFNESDKREWSVPCEKCGTINQLDWFKHVVECVRDKMGNILSYELLDREWKSGDKRDIFMLCESCRNPINRFSPQGLWVPNNPEGTYEGYHISKLFTRQASVVSMWKDFVKSTANPSLMDWFYMSILGIPPSSQGNRVTPEIMAGAARAKEFLLAGNEAYVSEKVPGPCTMGIDVGSFLDIRISRVLAGKRVAVYLGRVNTQDEVYELMKRYNVEYAVIDCGPELHLVDEIQNSAPCSVWRCRFNSAEGKIQNISYDTSNMEIKVDRTFIMDRSLAQLRRGKNILPKNYDSVFGGDYLKQMTASVRERVLDPSGNERYEWMKTEDHHWLADCYDLLAADFMVDGTLTDIEVL